MIFGSGGLFPLWVSAWLPGLTERQIVFRSLVLLWAPQPREENASRALPLSVFGGSLPCSFSLLLPRFPFLALSHLLCFEHNTTVKRRGEILTAVFFVARRR